MMNTPPLILGAAMLLWGWQTGHWAVAALCALAFESARYVPQRWTFSTERLARINDFCAVLAALLGVYLYVTAGNPRAITQFFLWLPIVYLPLALSQAYGTHRDMDLAILFWSMRRRRALNGSASNQKAANSVGFPRVNIGYLYFSGWIIAASAANRRDGSFEPMLIALAAWALWQARPRARPAGLWVLLIALAAGLGYTGHSSLRDLQLWLEGNGPEWIAGGGSSTNPYRADTDIGHIGELKQSDRIVMRVRRLGNEGPKLAAPLLLHRASYDRYTGLRWLAQDAAFTPVLQSGAAGSWTIANRSPGPAGAGEGTAGKAGIAIVEQTNHVNPVLALPSGTVRIEGLAASEMKQNNMGAVQVEHRPGFLPYRALLDAESPGSPLAPPPGRDDLSVPRNESGVLDQVVSELGLKRMSAEDAMAALERHFESKFSYSLYQGSDAPKSATPLADFLLRTRAGHCEYFATATVLLLRAAGIPARYATGFSAQEWNALEDAYLVRERHAHSWVRAWTGSAWRDVDTTPADWAVVENAAHGGAWWSRVADLWSWARLRFSQMQGEEGGTPLTWIAVAVLLSIWVGWRMFGRPAQRAAELTAQAAAAIDHPGADSAFYRIEAGLAARGWGRARGETPREWISRIGPHMDSVQMQQAGAQRHGGVLDELRSLLNMHYRYRFDPYGLAPADREAFTARVDAWLAQFALERT